jgi:predicted kinase
MEAVVFSGVQGSGKSTFFRERFFATHVRLNLDMLRTRNREDILLHACLAAQQPFVVDNTNPTRRQRERYARLAAAAGFSAVLYYFESKSADALARNAARPEPFRVPDLAILGTLAKLEPPSPDEGFGRIYRVRITDATAGSGNVGGFDVREWANEV